MLRDVGGVGQRKLKAARVCVVGAGGLGAPRCYISRRQAWATIQRHRRRRRFASNLQRQGPDPRKTHRPAQSRGGGGGFCETSIRMRASVGHRIRLDAGNVADLIGASNIVAEGSDNFDYALYRFGRLLLRKKAAGDGGAWRFRRSLTTLRPFEPAPDGLPIRPIAACFRQPPLAGEIPTCEEAAFSARSPEWSASMMALEVVREIVGFGEGWSAVCCSSIPRPCVSRPSRYAWDPENPLSGRKAARKAIRRDRQVWRASPNRRHCAGPYPLEAPR